MLRSQKVKVIFHFDPGQILLTIHTYTHTKNKPWKVSLYMRKKKLLKKKLTKKRNKWTCSVFSWCDAQPVSGISGDREFFYIYIIYTSIYIWIYLHHLAIGSVGDPFQSRKQPIFFFCWPPSSSLDFFFIFFHRKLLRLFLPTPLFFCVTTQRFFIISLRTRFWQRTGC